MKAEAKSLRFLGESPQKITVPFFQRRYVWEESNWEELYENVKDINTKPFLGSIIIKTVPGQNPSEAVIVDGQQRLTTLTILSKVIYDCLSEQENEGVESDIKNFLFYKINSADPFRNSEVKLYHSKSDAEDYNFIIRAGLLNDTKIDPNTLIDNGSNILKCYAFFRKKVKGASDEDLKQLHNNLFNDNRKMIVLVTLDELDVNEQSIFDSINRTGVRLNSADIIKNFLFQRCLDLCGENKTAVYDLYDKYWGDYFYINGGVENLWDKERSFGNNQRTNLEFLLYCVAIIKWGWSERVFSDLPSVYKNQTQKYKFNDFDILIKDIHNYANIFYNCVLSLQKKLQSEEPVLFSFKNYRQRFLLILEKFGVQMFYPYVIKRFSDYYSMKRVILNDVPDLTLREAQLYSLNQKFDADLRKLESFVVRNRIIRSNVSDYTLKCSDLIHKNDGNLISIWFTQDSNLLNQGINRYLSDVVNDTGKMLLFNIELYLRRDSGEDINELQYKYTLEHIMPKAWKTHWSTVPILNEDGSILPYDTNNNPPTNADQEAIDYRNSCLNNLGNMTLLTKTLNASIRNSIYAAKVNGVGNVGGYINYSSLKITRMLVDSFNSGDIVWNEQSIRHRRDYFLEVIDLIWPVVQPL